MRLAQVMVFLVLLLPMTVSVWAGEQLDVDDGSQVTITSPQNGQTVGDGI